MEKILLTILFALPGLVCYLPAKGQLFKQYKEETATFTYMQFPTQPERKSEVIIEFAEKNLLGAAASKVIKNQAIAGALTAKGGVLGDETTVSAVNLIPDVFPTDGDLLAEVSLSAEFKSKKTMNLPVETYNYVDNGETVDVLTSFKVFTLPEKELIYSHPRAWVRGMVSKSASGAPVSGSALESAKKNIARGWAKGKLNTLYGISRQSVTLPVYLIKKQDRKDEKKAEEVQETMASCIRTLFRDRGTDEYLFDVDKCIRHYHSMLEKYQPGTEKQKEALVTDNNVWCLYYNLAVAYTLKDDKPQARTYMQKAVDIRRPKPEEIKGKDGEKKGEFHFGLVDPEEQYYITSLENLTTDYFDGMEKMNPVFVGFLYSEDQIRNASRIARKWGGNLLLSEGFGLEQPANFVCPGIDKSPKLMTGSVKLNGDQVNYNLKKGFLFPLTKKYTLKASKSDLSAKTRQKYASSMLPASYGTAGGYSLYLGDDRWISLASYNDTYKAVSNADKTKYFGKTQFQYDYNGDILVKNTLVKDTWIFYNYVSPTEGEVLEIIETSARISHDDYREKSVEIETATIERQREAKFFEALLQKKLAPEEPLVTHELSRETSSMKITYAGEEIVVVKDGKSTSGKIVRKTDEKGNCTRIEMGECELERTFTY